MMREGVGDALGDLGGDLVFGATSGLSGQSTFLGTPGSVGPAECSAVVGFYGHLFHPTHPKFRLFCNSNTRKSTRRFRQDGETTQILCRVCQTGFPVG
jgi:hypothetical protein